MASRLMLSEKPVDIAVNMVPENDRARTPVKVYTARIKLRDDTGKAPGKADRIYITEGGGVNQFYDFIVDFNKIDISLLVELSPVTVPPDLFTNEEQLAGLINRHLGINLGKLDIIYDPIPFGATEVTIEIDNRSLIYKGSFVVLLANTRSLFEGIERTAVFGFEDANLPLT